MIGFIASDPDAYAVFIGDNRSGGAGYLLTTSSMSSGIYFLAGNILSDSCSIELNKTGTYTFATKTESYVAQTPVEVIVTNAGTSGTGALTVALSGTGDLAEFTDAGKIHSWARDAMAWAVAEGIMEGNGDGTINPTGLATRAEVAQIFLNYFGK